MAVPTVILECVETESLLTLWLTAQEKATYLFSHIRIQVYSADLINAK